MESCLTVISCTRVVKSCTVLLCGSKKAWPSLVMIDNSTELPDDVLLCVGKWAVALSVKACTRLVMRAVSSVSLCSACLVEILRYKK